MEMTKKRIIPEEMLAWSLRSQQRNRELQEQFQKDCESGKIDELLKRATPVEPPLR